MAGDKPGSDRARKISEMRAAQKRKDRKRKSLFGAVVVVVVGGMVAGGVFAAQNKHNAKTQANPTATPSASIAPAGTGPEGIVLEQGTVLAGLDSAGTGQTLDGIQCEASEQVAYHVHAHVAIYVDGVLRPVPIGIGIVPPIISQGPGGPFASAGKCYYWLHTHTNDGIIHIESPTQTTYTLAQFFAIWGIPLSPTMVGGASGPVTAYVNGQQWGADPGSIPLQSRAVIQLNVGSNNPGPQTVDWSKSQL
ncbi:MAG TPA: hypothetical protein VHV82_18725 [Sporichthyaceae bacterium]|jgi:hypothetical protein|nr:hypothetical protein [Sporichthyaceae bacterium]